MALPLVSLRVTDPSSVSPQTLLQTLSRTSGEVTHLIIPSQYAEKYRFVIEKVAYVYIRRVGDSVVFELSSPPPLDI